MILQSRSEIRNYNLNMPEISMMDLKLKIANTKFQIFENRKVLLRRREKFIGTRHPGSLPNPNPEMSF